MASLTPFLKQRFFDANGAPLVGGKLYAYTAGTTTPRATYADQTGLVPNTNPIILDANGEANVWIGNGFYKFVLMNSVDVVQYTIDRVSSGTGGEIPTSDLAVDRFSGTGAQLIFTLTADPLAQVNTNVFINGVYQQKDTYTLAGAVLTFSEAPPLGTNNIEVSRGTAMAVGSIGDLTITAPKIANGAVTNAKLLNASVTTDKISDGSVTTPKLADGSVTSAKKAALGQQISSSSTTFVSSSLTYVDVTNLTVTITTTGRPVWISLISDTANPGYIATTCSSGGANAYFAILRGGAILVEHLLFTTATQTGVPSSVLSYIDTPAAGTYTYKIQAKCLGTGPSAQVQWSKLVAFEL